MKLFILFVIASVIIFAAKDCTPYTNNKKETSKTICNNQSRHCSIKKLKEKKSIFFNQPFFTFKYSL